MSINEVKKWVVILVASGMLVSLGGSWAITNTGVAQNSKDIERNRIAQEVARDLLQQDIDCNSDEIREVSQYQYGLERDMAVVKNDLAWLRENVATLVEQGR